MNRLLPFALHSLNKVFLGALFLFSSVSAPTAIAATPGELIKITLPESTTRELWMKVPTNYDPAKKWPLILSYHGSGWTNPSLYPFDEIVQNQDFLVMGMRYAEGGGPSATRKEIRHFRDAVALACQYANVDKKKVFVGGYSTGGVHSLHLGENVDHEELAGVVCISSSRYLNEPHPVPTSKMANFPIFQGVGALDTVVSGGSYGHISLSADDEILYNSWNADYTREVWPNTGHTIDFDATNCRNWLLQRVLTNPVTITANSTYGVISPAANFNTLVHEGGQPVTYSVTSPISSNATTRYTATGWTATAATPSSGTGATATFTPSANSSVTWTWDPEYFLELNTADSTAPAWTPNDASALAWYDAQDAATITTSGSDVTQWADKSGNTHHLNAMASGSPSAGLQTINAKNAIQFDSDEGMQTVSNPFGSTISEATAFVVYKPNVATQGRLFTLSGSDSATERWSSHAPWNNGILYFDCGGTAPPNRINTASNAWFTANQDYLLSYTSQTGLQEVRVDGDVLISDSTGHSVTTSGGMVIGGSSNLTQDSAIGEVVILNGAVDATTRQKVEGYLAHHWGLEGNLDTAHPYKATPPSAGGTTLYSGTLSQASDWHSPGGTIVLTATPNSGSSFLQWVGDTTGCTISGNQITIPTDQPRSITATFGAL